MKSLRIVLAASLALQEIAIPAFIMAQEAEANPQFQQEVQSGTGEQEGGPIDQTEMPKASPPGTPLEAVQVGGGRSTPLYEASENASPLESRVSVRVKNAPLSAFLDSISAQAKINFIITEGLETKPVTAFLRQVTVREALQILLTIKGLTYQRIGHSNTYVIMKRSETGPNLITKIYTLNYIALVPIVSETVDLVDVIAPQVSIGASGGGTREVKRIEGGRQPGGQGDKFDDMGISILAIIHSIQSKTGRLSIDARTNSLIVTDIAEVFPQIEQILQELDKKAPQVLLEAQIVEMNTDRVNQLGIEWGGSNGELAYFQGPARATDFLLRPGFFSGDNWKYFYPPASNFVDAPGSAPRGITYGIFSLQQLTALLRAMITRGEARYLGKPKIVTMNNKAALISVAKWSGIGFKITNQSTGGGGVQTTTELERAYVGLILKVTPQVNKEGYVTLLVQPSYSDLQTSAMATSNNPAFDTTNRGAATLLRIKNGQTAVIGGLLQSTENKTVRKVPLLGYIPIIGWLFTSVTSRKTNSDLVLFITPTILVD